MPQAIPAIAAAFASTAAAVTAVTSTVVLGLTVGTWLTVGATALSLGMALGAAAEAKKAGKALESTGQQLQLKAAGDSAPVPFMLGRTATGGYLVYRDGFGAKNAELAMLTVLSAGGPIGGIESYSAAEYGVGFGSNPNGGLASATGTSPSSGLYAGKMRQRWLTGAATDLSPADYSGGAAGPKLTSADKLPGLAHALMLCTYDTKAYPNGPPSKNLWVGSGLKFYDPRKDSTYPGGSGSHRWGHPETYEFTDNPGVVGLNWALGIWQNGKRVGGVGASYDEVDIPAFASMANVCDANHWTVGGVVTSDDNKFSVLNAILQAGSAVAAARGAQLSVIQNAPKASVYTITEDDVVGTVEVNNTTGFRDRKNTIVPRYRAETQGWEVIAGETVSASTYVTEDAGETRSTEIQYALVQNAAQAHQLAAYDLVNTREFLTASIVCKPRLLNVRVGDCVTVTLPDIAANDVKMLVVGRTLDPATLQVSLSLRAETDAKHAFALGQSQTAPPSPSLGGFDPSNPPAPANAAWWVSAGTVNSPSGVREPAIFLDGAADDPNASTVIVEIRKVGATAWTLYGEYPAPTTKHIDITGVSASVQYQVAVSYRTVRDVVSDNKLILGPVIPGDHVIPWTGNTIVDRPAWMFESVWAPFRDQYVPAILLEYANTVAEVQADLNELQQSTSNAALTGFAKQADLNDLAYASIQNVLDDVAEEVETKRLSYLDGIEVGTVVRSEQTRTNSVVETIDLMGAKNANSTAFIFDTSRVQVGNGVSMASKFAALEAATETANAVATQRINTVANAVAAEANARLTLASTVANNAATANQQFSTLSNATAALSQFTSTLGALTANGTAIVLDASKVQVSPSVTMASRDNLIDAKFNGTSNSAILTTATAAATNATAAVNTLTQMGATIGNGGSFILDSSKVNVGSGENLAQRLTNVSSSLSSKTTSADVSSIITASTGTGQTLASSLSSVSTTAGNASSTASLALSAANGNSSQAVLTVGAGGKISGFKVNGSTQSFDIIANRFSIVDNSGASPIVPFAVISGTAYMDNVVARNIGAGTITADKIVGGAVTNLVVNEYIGQAYFGTSEMEHMSFSYFCEGGKLSLDVYCEVGTNTSTPAGAVYRLYCDSSVYNAGAVYCTPSWGQLGSTTPVVVNPGYGSHTFRVTYQATPGSGSIRANRTYVRLTELKK